MEESQIYFGADPSSAEFGAKHFAPVARSLREPRALRTRAILRLNSGGGAET